MNGSDLSKQFDALKRQFMDLVRDLHARKLAVPAGAILVAIVAALVLLPKGSTPPPAPSTATITPAVKAKVQVAAQISMIEPTPIGDDIPLAGTRDPFEGETSYDCTVVSTNPKILECEVSDQRMYVLCIDPTAGVCGEYPKGGASGATGGAAGASGDTGGSGGDVPPSGGSGSGGGDSGSGGTRYFYYAATVKLDGTTYKKVTRGTMLPRSSSPLVAFIDAVGDDAGNPTGATFLAANGVTVSGVSMDPVFNSFALDPGQTVTLTDAEGKDHKFTLKSVDLVEQK